MKKNCFEFGSFLDTAYSGTADFGKVYTTIGTVITLIICIIFLIIGLVMVFKKNVYTKKTTMTVESVTPTGDASMGMLQYTVTGTINECSLPVTITTSTMYSKGDTLTVYYNPDKKCDISTVTNYKGMGIIFIVIALLVGTFSVINLFFVRKYKGVAAAEGVMDVFNLFRR